MSLTKKDLSSFMVTIANVSAIEPGEELLLEIVKTSSTLLTHVFFPLVTQKRKLELSQQGSITSSDALPLSYRRFVGARAIVDACYM